MISVILNVYKRPHMLERQIESILNQSVDIHPTDIHVWYNEAGIDHPDPKDVRINTYRCNWNTKFFGRFTIPLMCRSKYIAVFDDDNLPMENWLRSCLHTINRSESDGILGGTGVTIRKGRSVTKAGWNGDHLDCTTRVDYVGQTWFFRREWAKYMWYENPFTLENGEDITFGYLAQKYGGINTFVPPHPESDKSVWSTDFKTAWDEGRDENASWRLKQHLDVRYKMMEHYIKGGWKTVNSISYE